MQQESWLRPSSPQDHNPELQFLLPEVEDTLRLGQLLARAVAQHGGAPGIIMLQGELGAGKTTLVRGLTRALPGGDLAQVSSPSFNILNIYPTDPEVLHLDLYRISGPEAAESLWENLGQGHKSIVLIEWSENLAAEDYPKHYYLLALRSQMQGRTAIVRAFGCSLQPLWEQARQSGLIMQAKGE
ncbi:MAG: tRNA (adenosine(37)-N6)-threonylcarbamoyltransferase complex ATPase subunit type 1 TsaE [Desulfohalobiaceae bacterium]